MNGIRHRPYPYEFVPVFNPPEEAHLVLAQLPEAELQRMRLRRANRFPGANLPAPIIPEANLPPPQE